MSCLVITSGRNKGCIYELAPGGDTVIGRVSECNVHVLDARVSRRHCVISAGPAGLTIKDLQSVNGTFVNGVRITSTALKGGDRLVVGTTELEVRLVAPVDGRKTELLGSGGRQPTERAAALPAPVKAAEPAAAKPAQPAPVEAAKPAPAPEEVIEPAPIEVIEPVPAEAIEPTPAKAAEPVAAKPAQPAPVAVAKPALEEVIEPVPVEMIEPAPIEVIQPAPAAAVPETKAPAEGADGPGWFQRILRVFTRKKDPGAPEAK